MKILMFGRGPIAAVHGWALERAGHDVEFYVRPGRAATYGPAIELDLLDARKRPWGRRVVETWPVRYREELPPDHGYDLIVLSVLPHNLPEAAEFLAPRVGGATVLVFGNIWDEPLDAIGALPVEQVAWGFPQAGGGFDDDGVLRGAMLPSVVLGTIDRAPTDRERAVREVFRAARFRVQERPDFRSWLWVHYVSTAGLLAQAQRVGSMAELVGAWRELRAAMLTTRELLPLLEARGIDLRRHRATVLAFRAPAAVTGGLLALLTRYVPLLRVNFASHSDPDAREPREVCQDVLAEARRLGVATPRLAASEPYFTTTSP
jgi:2-dehydropantoate 2-reductase